MCVCGEVRKKRHRKKLVDMAIETINLSRKNANSSIFRDTSMSRTTEITSNKF